MRAHKVYESIDFQRGKDPKEAMKIGLKSRAFPIVSIKTYPGAKWIGGETLETYLKAVLDSKLGAFPKYAKSILFTKHPKLKRPISATWNIPELINLGFSGVIHNDTFVPFEHLKLEESMNFQRGVDPKEAMGIGKLADISLESIRNAFACVRNYSLEDLESIHRRIKAKSNIRLDGVPVEELSYRDWVDFNNKVVNGIKSFKRKQAKSFPFKKGDMLKVVHDGKTYFGVYDGVDKHGRIRAIGPKFRLLFSPEKYSKATPEEIEGVKKEEMASRIRKFKRLVSQGVERYQSLLDSLLRDYEKEFGESYEG